VKGSKWWLHLHYYFAVPKHLAGRSAVRERFTLATFPRGWLACDCAGGSPVSRVTLVTFSRILNRQRALGTILVTDVLRRRDKPTLQM
jgi:hypothetical protein